MAFNNSLAHGSSTTQAVTRTTIRHGLRIALLLAPLWLIRAAIEIPFALGLVHANVQAAVVIFTDACQAIVIVYYLYSSFALLRQPFLIVILTAGCTLMLLRSAVRALPAIPGMTGLTPDRLGTLADGTIVFGGALLLSGTFCYVLVSLKQSIVQLRKDRTALRQAAEANQVIQQALAKREELFRTLAESTSACIYIVQDGHFVYANRRTRELLGYTEEELLNTCFWDVIEESMREKSIAVTQRLLDGPLPRDTYQFTIRNKRGELRTVEASIAPYSLEERPAVLGTGYDVTERDQFEQQLRQAQKMESVGRLAGGVAHDFNNMLSLILGHAELALEGLGPTSPIRNDIREIVKAGQRSADLTHQLLAFARKQTISRKVLDLNDAITRILKMLGRLIGEDIDLLWKPGKDLWPVHMDPAQIDQILANLMVNARDAIDGAGKITIETAKAEFDEIYCETHAGYQPGHYLMLAVSDNGCGMDKETTERLFEPFYTTKEVGKGTGLGLATIYGIVKQNDGFINVYSEPGRGTTFRIYFPAHLSGITPNESTDQPPEAQTGTETILLVEDEASLLKLAKKQLEQLGYTVLATSSPQAAIQLASDHEQKIHLLMTDVVMPEISGREVWESLQETCPDLKCLFMSGYTANVIAHHGVLDDGIHFLQKPFAADALAKKIREVLDATPA